MYVGKNKVIIIIVVVLLFLTIGVAGYLGYSLAGAKESAREAREKYTELQRVIDDTKEVAEQRLANDRKLISGTRAARRRVKLETEEIAVGSEAIERELREIITQSENLEYRSLDSGGSGCYYPVGNAVVESTKVE